MPRNNAESDIVLDLVRHFSPEQAVDTSQRLQLQDWLLDLLQDQLQDSLQDVLQG